TTIGTGERSSAPSIHGAWKRSQRRGRLDSTISWFSAADSRRGWSRQRVYRPIPRGSLLGRLSNATFTSNSLRGGRLPGKPSLHDGREATVNASADPCRPPAGGIRDAVGSQNQGLLRGALGALARAARAPRPRASPDVPA